MAALQTKMDEMTELMKTLTVAQNQPPPPPIRTQAENVSIGPEWSFCADTPKYFTPQRSIPWFPPFSAGEILRPIACEAQMPIFQRATHVPQQVTTFPPAAVTYSAPAVHTIPQEEEPIFHFGSVGA
jgi:hypothetical protein